MASDAITVAMRALFLLCSLLLLSCTKSSCANERVLRRTLFFRGEAAAAIEERVTQMPKYERVVRVTTHDATNITTTLDATLDSLGYLKSARYVRHHSDPTRPPMRIVSIQDGLLYVDETKRELELPIRVVLVELSHRLRITKPAKATLLELSSLEMLDVDITRAGAVFEMKHGDDIVLRVTPDGLRTGPGAFDEGDTATSRQHKPVDIAVPGLVSVRDTTLRGAVQPTGSVTASDRHATPFIESDHHLVRTFAGPLCRETVVATAVAVGDAVHALVRPNINVPPGATQMIMYGGDCDVAAALVAASLRYCGYRARPVTGYLLMDPGKPHARLTPHAVAEIYEPYETDGQWWRVDATMPSVVKRSEDTRFLPVAVGLGGALSMGQVLGVVDALDVVAPAAAE